MNSIPPLTDAQRQAFVENMPTGSLNSDGAPLENKPVMSHTEASWHETQAGNRAKAEAEQQGGDQEAQRAIADVTSTNKVVAGYELKPASQGTIFAIQEVGRCFEAYAEAEQLQSSEDVTAPGLKELLEIGLSVLVFADARRCYDVVRKRGIKELLNEAQVIIWDLPVEVASQLNEHFTNEMARITRLNGNEERPGKPQEVTECGVSNDLQSCQRVTG